MRSIILPHGWQAWPHVYEPAVFPADPKLKQFSVSVPVELVSDIEGIRSRDGRVHVSSRSRPEVRAMMGVDWLVTKLARYDARNVGRDRLLADHILEVCFEPRPIEASPIGSFTKLILTSVEVRPQLT